MQDVPATSIYMHFRSIIRTRSRSGCSHAYIHVYSRVYIRDAPRIMESGWVGAWGGGVLRGELQGQHLILKIGLRSVATKLYMFCFCSFLSLFFYFVPPSQFSKKKGRSHPRCSRTRAIPPPIVHCIKYM